MKFAVLALLAAVARASDDAAPAADATRGNIGLGGQCSSTTEGDGCVAGHRCGKLDTAKAEAAAKAAAEALKAGADAAKKAADDTKKAEGAAEGGDGAAAGDGAAKDGAAA